MSIYFSKEEGRGQALREWWNGLDRDRGSRAVLRRAATLTEVALTPTYQKLCRRLGAQDWASWERDRFAAIVGLLAHIKQNDTRSPVKAMGRAQGADKAAVSELRFIRLLDSPDIDTLFTGLRRVLPLMGNSVDVIALANDLMSWGDRVKKEWAYGYDWPDKSAA